MKTVRRAGMGSFVAVVLWAVLPAVAGAVVVQTPSGRLAGITFRPGVNPASIPGIRLVTHAGGAKANGNVDYNGGPVLHSVAPYLIYWDPSSAITVHSKGVLNQYLTDVAAASGTPTDVYAALRQYTDSTGFSATSEAFTAATQAIVDTQPYPTTDTANCATGVGFASCVTDGQLQAEITRLITADGLPSGTGPNAPIYLMITPANVNICSGASCASNAFCAYHSFYTHNGTNVLYATIPFIVWTANASKGCQFDGTGPYQTPNSDQADNIVDNLSHELSEAITDPVLNAWWNSTTSGNEVGDNCASYAATSNPNNGVSANAYLPTLGGSAVSGTLYDQLINGHQYYTQTEWSNGNVNCEGTPSADTLTGGFTDTAPGTSGVSVGFTPTSSTSGANTITSTTWSFGDGSAPVFTTAAPAATAHAFTAAGTYTVTMTLVDSLGNLTTVSHSVVVTAPPVAAFAATAAVVPVGGTVGFNGAGSSDPNAGATITGYSWNFGDGSAAGSGASTTHAYTTAGTYHVTLTVTDSLGLTGAISHVVVVAKVPTPAFTPTAASGTVPFSVAFSGAGSSDPNAGGSIVAYSWSFGDGSAAGSGATPTHAYARVGTFTVTLTVTDSFGLTGSVTHAVLVLPKAVIVVRTGHPKSGKQVKFDGSTSHDPGGHIVSYSWSFGDGHKSSKAKPSHTYAKPGKYHVKLTITDSSGLKGTATKTVVVKRH